MRCDSGLVFYGVCGGSLEDCSAGDGTGVGGRRLLCSSGWRQLGGRGGGGVVYVHGSIGGEGSWVSGALASSQGLERVFVVVRRRDN